MSKLYTNRAGGFAQLSLFILFLISVLTGTAYADEKQLSDREELCGVVYPVTAYTATLSGLKIVLRANDQLFVNGRLVAQSQTVSPWYDSANTASIGRFGDEILIETNNTDCVDLSKSHYYLLRKDGTLRASGPLFTENHYSGFVAEGKDLIYWSDWFCSQDNHKRKPAQSYVYILKQGAAEFVKEDRPEAQVCAQTSQTQLKVNSIRLNLMAAISPK